LEEIPTERFPTEKSFITLDTGFEYKTSEHYREHSFNANSELVECYSLTSDWIVH